MPRNAMLKAGVMGNALKLCATFYESNMYYRFWAINFIQINQANI
jgi:hypothetical protein